MGTATEKIQPGGFRNTGVLGVTLVACCAVFALAGAPTRVGITPDGRLLVNDRPTFFIALSPGPPTDLLTPEGTDGWKELAEGGVNVIRGDTRGHRSWTPDAQRDFARLLDTTWNHRIYVLPYLRELVELREENTREELARFVSRFKDHPGVLFWKSADEPEWGKLPVEPLREAYDIIRRTDPDRPVWFCHAPRGTLETLRPYNVACDILSTDIYPVSDPPGKHSREANKGLSMVGDYTRRMVELAEGRKMVFMILQGCWSGVLPQRGHRLMFPTPREERYMLYQAIICGANSVGFFGLTFGLDDRDAKLGFNWTWWRAVLRPLLAEIRPGSELYPVLTAPDSTYPLEFTGAPQVEARWKDAGIYVYIFAAAREGPDRKVRFSGLQDGEVTVLFENRTLQVVNGAFEDQFHEHDVHIYRALRVLPPPTTSTSEPR